MNNRPNLITYFETYGDKEAGPLWMAALREWMKENKVQMKPKVSTEKDERT
jgi:hypothetical protein